MKRRRAARTGTTLVETAVLLGLFLFLVVGVLDMGLALMRRHILQAGADHAVRRAVVYGKYAATPWGPQTLGPAAASLDHPAAEAVRSRLVGISPDQVVLTVEWLDGSNEPGCRVRVKLATTYDPVLFGLMEATPLVAQAVQPISR